MTMTHITLLLLFLFLFSHYVIDDTSDIRDTSIVVSTYQTIVPSYTTSLRLPVPFITLVG